MKNSRTIDAIDKAILNMLQENARISNADIARAVSMAPSAVLERLRKLERKGFIIGYEARVNPKAVGKALTAFTAVHVEEAVGQPNTGDMLATIPGVMEVHYTAGSASYLVKVRARDTEELADILQQIGRIDTVRDTTSTVVLRTMKESSVFPIETDQEDADG